MSYESAIKKANDILKVVKFFKENPEYVDDERREVSNGTKITIDSLFDTSNNNCSTIELAYDYISLNRKYDEVTIERHENEESFKISDILSLSTEEGYFQGSTVYNEGTLDNLCTFSVLYQKSVLDIFYLDTEKLDRLVDFVTIEEASV
ncbi:hypothetical protein EO157G_3530 [Escherichia phage SP27]|uniref:Uncharacterized protein n=1 Tax=Escherichia phage SP27 TaxID=2495557 RepID=A0A5A4U689_9CAUD|nr:hypothetical protein [Escherichia coli]BBM61942.1 hypothetical protein EO157G_3530 [Escherichia phage SP27]